MVKLHPCPLKYISPFLSIIFLANFQVYAGNIKINKLQTYKQTASPDVVDNYMFATYFSHAKKAYNLRGFEIGSTGNNIIDLKMNPAGYSFALLYGKPGKTAVRIQSLNPSRNLKEDLKGLVAPTAICYMPDSRQIAIADDGKIKFYNSKNFQLEREIPVVNSPLSLTISPNGEIAIVLYPDIVRIIALSSGEIRKTLNLSSPGSVAFNPSGSQFGILTESGELTTYSTSDFSIITDLKDLGSAKNLFFHSDENYAGMIINDNHIQFVNLYDTSDRPAIYENNPTWAKFLHDGSGTEYLATADKNSIKYRQVEGFEPNYNLMLNKMVEERMREWTKMRPGETELEYLERVSEESLRKQRLQFINEISSELALTAGLGNFSDVTLGRYNPTDGTLIISLGGLNDIYLSVPPEDMAGFGDGNNLQFSNHVFSLTPENNFNLIYVQVYNPTNGKTYIFDNLDKQDLSFLMSDNNFVSLNLIMQSAREDVMLNEIKNSILEEARKNNILSDHTTINVETHIEPATDDMGRRINNYHIDFTYSVDSQGSAKEDFAPGKYQIEQSPAAMSLARIIQQAFTNEFAPYLTPGKKLIMNITGSADALPINGAITYNGSFGQFDEEPCYINGNLTTISVNSKDAIRTNEQLAFMRAQALQQNMKLNIPKISEMNFVYQNNIEVSKEKGAAYRRINVSLIFVDAF